MRWECAEISSRGYDRKIRLVEGGRFATESPGRHSLAGRIGRGAKPPPQFGHTLKSTLSTQSAQKVHSYEQIRAIVDAGGRSRSQYSQFGRSSSTIDLPRIRRVENDEIRTKMCISRLLLTPLAWLGRQGTRAVAAVVLVGVVAPPIDALVKPFVTQAIFGLLVIAFVRLDGKLLRIHLSRPGLVLAATAWTALMIPLLCGVACLALGLDMSAPDLFVSVMLHSVAPPMMAAPALASLMGLDATLVLVTLVTSAALNPVTAPLLAYAFAGPSLTLSPVTLGLKLFAILAGSAAVAGVIRRAAGADAISRYKAEIDGINIIVMFVFVGAVMENLLNNLIADPVWVLGLAALAFSFCFGVLGVTIAVFAWSGRPRAFALGFMASQRNLGLMLAATGGVLPDVSWLWFALSQFPIYLAPQILKPVVRRLLPEPQNGSLAQSTPIGQTL